MSAVVVIALARALNTNSHGDWNMKTTTRCRPANDLVGRPSRKSAIPRIAILIGPEPVNCHNIFRSRDLSARSVLNPTRHYLVLLPDIDTFFAHQLFCRDGARGRGLFEFGEYHAVVEVAVFERIATGRRIKYSLDSRPVASCGAHRAAFAHGIQ